MSVIAKPESIAEINGGGGWTQRAGNFGKISSQTTGFLTTKLGVPSSCLLMIEKYSGGKKYLRSADDGSWEFDFLQLGSYFKITSVDESGTLNSGVLDWVQPE